MAVIGSVALLVLPRQSPTAHVPSRAKDMPTMALYAMIGFPLAVLICALLTRERPASAAAVKQKFSLADYLFAGRRMWRVVLADLVLTLGPGTTAPIYVYFFHDAKGFVDADVGFLLIFYIGAGILGAPFWGRVARRFGKHRTVQIACVFYGITQTILMALPKVHPGYHLFPDGLPTALGMFCVGFCASAFILLIRAMVADIVDEVKLETRRDLTSLMFSMVTTTTKIGQAVTVSIVFPILAMVGYNGKEGAVNTPHAIFGLEMCYLLLVVLVWFGGAMFFGYKLDAKRHAEIREALALDLAAGEESLTGPRLRRWRRRKSADRARAALEASARPTTAIWIAPTTGRPRRRRRAARCLESPPARQQRGLDPRPALAEDRNRRPGGRIGKKAMLPTTPRIGVPASRSGRRAQSIRAISWAWRDHRRRS